MNKAKQNAKIAHLHKFGTFTLDGQTFMVIPCIRRKKRSRLIIDITELTTSEMWIELGY